MRTAAKPCGERQDRAEQDDGVGGPEVEAQQPDEEILPESEFYRQWPDGTSTCTAHAARKPCHWCECLRRCKIREREQRLERESEERRAQRHREEVEQQWWEYNEQFKLARRDVERVAKRVRYAKCRKARPQWALPNEIWRILLFPKGPGEGEARAGVGFAAQQTDSDVEPVDGEMIKHYLTCVFAQMRCRGVAPPIWHRAQGNSLHKKNRW